MRRIRVFTIFLLWMVLFVIPSDVTSTSKNDEELSNVFANIINYYNSGDTTILDYIDSTNTKLYQKVRGNLGKGTINYNEQINVKSLDNDEYLIGIRMEGSGKVYNSKWAFSDMFMTFRFKYDSDRNIYIMTDTDFFENSGIDLIRKAYSELLINVLVISFFIFVVIMLISYKIYRKAMEDEKKSSSVHDNNAYVKKI